MIPRRNKGVVVKHYLPPPKLNQTGNTIHNISATTINFKHSPGKDKKNKVSYDKKKNQQSGKKTLGIQRSSLWFFPAH